VDLDGEVAGLTSAGDEGYRTWRNAVSRGIDHDQTPLSAYRVPHVALASGVDLCSDNNRWLPDP